MPSTPSTAPEVCSRLQDRLRDAEARVKTALAESDPDHPLAGAATQLLDIHKEMRDLLVENFAEDTTDPPRDDDRVVQAAIEIEREQHEPKADFTDVLKALFMWRDDPVDRARKPGGADGG